MAKHAPVPFKRAARATIHGLVMSLGSLIDHAKGTLGRVGSIGDPDDGIPQKVELTLAPIQESGIDGELILMVEALNGILASYEKMDAAKTLPNKQTVRGARSLVGKSVHVAADAPKKVRELFGSAAREALAETEDEVTGEVRVSLAGLDVALNKALVVLKKAS